MFVGEFWEIFLFLLKINTGHKDKRCDIGQKKKKKIEAALQPEHKVSGGTTLDWGTRGSQDKLNAQKHRVLHPRPENKPKWTQW